VNTYFRKTRKKPIIQEISRSRGGGGGGKGKKPRGNGQEFLGGEGGVEGERKNRKGGGV